MQGEKNILLSPNVATMQPITTAYNYLSVTTGISDFLNVSSRKYENDFQINHKSRDTLLLRARLVRARVLVEV